jgi:glyoxylase-like metal-dependent hydrolase (beta-lactamase superfamily II)
MSVNLAISTFAGLVLMSAAWARGISRHGFGGVVVEVVHRKGGHTPGDSMVWLPQNGVVFTGDEVYVPHLGPAPGEQDL